MNIVPTNAETIGPQSHRAARNRGGGGTRGTSPPGSVQEDEDEETLVAGSTQSGAMYGNAWLSNRGMGKTDSRRAGEGVGGAAEVDEEGSDGGGGEQMREGGLSSVGERGIEKVQSKVRSVCGENSNKKKRRCGQRSTVCGENNNKKERKKRV